MCKRVDVNFLLIYFLHSFQTHLVSLLWSWFCSCCSLILEYCLLLHSHILLIHTYPNASHSSRLKPYGISSQESFSTTCISFLRIHLTPYLCLCIDMILSFIINVCVFSFLLDSELLWGGKMLIHRFQYLCTKWKQTDDIFKYYRWRQFSRDNSQWHATVVSISLSIKPFLY